MALPKKTIWKLESHTRAKHRILERYLQAWFPILNTHHGRILYLDGFSGPGKYEEGEPGSPIIALDVALTHRKKFSGELAFIFIEKDPDRLNNLKSEISRLDLPDNFSVQAVNDEFDKVVSQALDNLDKEKANLAPAFTFVDPFGFSGVDFKLIERLLSHNRSEVFVTFMVDSINRFLSTPDDNIKKHIVTFFGTEDVLKIAEMPGGRIVNLTNFYQERLRTLARFVRIFEMRDADDRIIYYLVFASKNRLGHVKMKEAMWNVDKEGDFRFSDATNPSQIVLFQESHQERLFKLQQTKFAGVTKVEVEVLRVWVEDYTPYLKTHLGLALKYAEDKGLISVEETKSNGKPRKGQTFPDDVLISFK